jgi:hypothetical protein
MKKEQQQPYSETIFRMQKLIQELVPGYLIQNEGPAVWHPDSRYWPVVAEIPTGIDFAEKETESWLMLEHQVYDSSVFIYDTKENTAIEIGCVLAPDNITREQHIYECRVDDETMQAVVSLYCTFKNDQEQVAKHFCETRVYKFSDHGSINTMLIVKDYEGKPWKDPIVWGKFQGNEWMAGMSKKVPVLVNLRTGITQNLIGWTSIKSISGVSVYQKDAIVVCCLRTVVDDGFKSDPTNGVSVFISHDTSEQLHHLMSVSYDSWYPTKVFYQDSSLGSSYVEMKVESRHGKLLGAYAIPVSMAVLKNKSEKQTTELS